MDEQLTVIEKLGRHLGFKD